ncbi:hypothetical protein HK405_011198, partial [Cladochytrium tenue]
PSPAAAPLSANVAATKKRPSAGPPVPDRTTPARSRKRARRTTAVRSSPPPTRLPHDPRLVVSDSFAAAADADHPSLLLDARPLRTVAVPRLAAADSLAASTSSAVSSLAGATVVTSPRRPTRRRTASSTSMVSASLSSLVALPADEMATLSPANPPAAPVPAVATAARPPPSPPARVVVGPVGRAASSNPPTLSQPLSPLPLPSQYTRPASPESSPLFSNQPAASLPAQSPPPAQPPPSSSSPTTPPPSSPTSAFAAGNIALSPLVPRSLTSPPQTLPPLQPTHQPSPIGFTPRNRPPTRVPSSAAESAFDFFGSAAFTSAAQRSPPSLPSPRPPAPLSTSHSQQPLATFSGHLTSKELPLRPLLPPSSVPRAASTASSASRASSRRRRHDLTQGGDSDSDSSASASEAAAASTSPSPRQQQSFGIKPPIAANLNSESPAPGRQPLPPLPPFATASGPNGNDADDDLLDDDLDDDLHAISQFLKDDLDVLSAARRPRAVAVAAGTPGGVPARPLPAGRTTAASTPDPASSSGGEEDLDDDDDDDSGSDDGASNGGRGAGALPLRANGPLSADPIRLLSARSSDMAR